MSSLFRQAGQSQTLDEVLDEFGINEHRVLAHRAEREARYIFEQTVDGKLGFVRLAEPRVGTGECYQRTKQRRVLEQLRRESLCH